MATLTEVSAEITPNQTLQAGDLDTTWRNNPEALRLAAFGANPLLQSSAHNHGAGRGMILDRPLLSLSFGPHAEEGSATAPQVGVPMLPASVTAFSEQAKLMASSPLFIPGGVGAVYVDLCISFAGPIGDRTLDLSVEIRPLSEAGYNPAGLTGVEVTGTFSASGAAFAPYYMRKEYAFTEAALAALGDISRDREFEICVWLKSEPQASTYVNRLISLIAYPGSAPSSLPSTDGISAPNVVFVSPQSIHAGETLTAQTGEAALTRINQDTISVLGTAPGIAFNDEGSWRARIRRAHQHQGWRNTNAADEPEPDGVCLRYGLWSQCYQGEFGESGGPPPTAMDSGRYQGILIHATSPLSTDWVIGEGRCSIPKGLGACDVRFAVQPVTSERETRLYFYAHLVAVNANSNVNLITSITSGPHSELPVAGVGRAPGSSTAYAILLVDPIDGPLWIKNGRRRGAGLGLWTTDALLPNDRIPDAAITSNAYRISQPVHISFAVPKTGDYRLRFKWALEYGAAGSGTYATTPRVVWCGATPSSGY
jgi:hypothetical protein